MPATATAPRLPAVPAPLSSLPDNMNREFIARNDIIERYLAGKLPTRGAVDLERYCKENPDLLEEAGISARVQAGLKLMEAGGMPLPWEEKPRRFWEHLPVFVLLVALVLGLGFVALRAQQQRGADARTIAALQASVQQRPNPAITGNRALVIAPDRNGPSAAPGATIGGGLVELVELKFRMEWSAYSQFRVTVERLGQGRVLVLGNLSRDSNGHLRLALNSGALGPGKYQFLIEGLTLSGEATAQAWYTLQVA